jgi:hypothetical protein
MTARYGRKPLSVPSMARNGSGNSKIRRLPDRTRPDENHAKRVGTLVVVDLHSGLQYLEILLVRYAVTAPAASRSTSTKTGTGCT